jgi:hypothetical protein
LFLIAREIPAFYIMDVLAGSFENIVVEVQVTAKETGLELFVDA